MSGGPARLPQRQTQVLGSPSDRPCAVGLSDDSRSSCLCVPQVTLWPGMSRVRWCSATTTTAGCGPCSNGESPAAELRPVTVVAMGGGGVNGASFKIEMKENGRILRMEISTRPDTGGLL